VPDFDVAGVFQAEFAKAVQDEVDHSGFAVQDWFWSGRRSPEEDIAWWQENGPEMVQAFVDWYEHNPDAEVWVTPDGIPAIELPIEVMFGSVPVRMILDLVLQIGTALVVVDVKTSARQPDSHRQLGIYACGLELKYGIRPRYGTFFMNRGTGPKAGPKTFFQRPIELGRPRYSLPYLTREFEMFEQGIKAGVFPAHPGEACARCGVAHACTEVGGSKARELDPNFPGWKG
jgi:putative RecB family exonuclease